MDFVIDGTFEALLTAVYEYFERKPPQATLQLKHNFIHNAFMPHLYVHADRRKAARVWAGLEKALPKSWQRRIWCCYLCESQEAMAAVFFYCTYVFGRYGKMFDNYGEPPVLQVSLFAERAEREKHRMEAFVRFKKTTDNIYYACIEPDYDVLPLISNHFKKRYADQQWMIYDLARKYGLYHQTGKVYEVNFDALEGIDPAKLPRHALDDKENTYALLWRDYIRSVNIDARKNTALHVKHVPKRYWRYLTEKFL